MSQLKSLYLTLVIIGSIAQVAGLFDQLNSIQPKPSNQIILASNK